MHTLADAGVSRSQIATRFQICRKTVIARLSAGRCPARAIRRARVRLVTPFAEEIAACYGRGGTNAVARAHRLRALGSRGTDATVRRAVAAWRARRPSACEGASTPDPPSRPSVPVASARQAAWLLRKYVSLHRALEQQCPALAMVRALGDRFVAMLHARDPSTLTPWLAEADRSEVRIFAAGLRRDEDAVLAARCFRWSNGQVEGQVHRLKLGKRAMYGRASFPRFRRRILPAA